MQRDNLIHKKARSRSLSLSASKYWEKLDYFIESGQSGKAQESVDELKKSAMQVVRSLDFLSNVLYKKYTSQVIEYQIKKLK